MHIMVKRKATGLNKEGLKAYLEQRYDNVKDISLIRLGSGWHGSGYLLKFSHKGGDEELIIKTISPVGFSHDYLSDRISALLLSHHISKSIPKHIESVDIIGKTAHGSVFSIADAADVYQVQKKATGIEYSQDLERIKKTNKAQEKDDFPF